MLWGSLTMYRTMLYFLGIVLAAALVLSALGILHYSAADILLQTLFLIAVCWGVNKIFSWFLKSKSNPESSLITALILSCVAGPFSLSEGWQILTFVSIAAIASKYVLALNQSHIFNPAAFGVAIGAIVFGQSATWWVGDTLLMPVILLGGLWVISKIRRFHVVFAFFGAYFGLLALEAVFVQGREIQEIAVSFWRFLQFSPLLFFAFVMLVEPLTSPQTQKGRTMFGIVVGAVFLFVPRLFSNLAFPLEFSLFIGNIFTRLFNADFRQSFTLVRKELPAPQVGSFWFEPVRQFAFSPGQFLEYTLSHPRSDSRGIRRYFTIASSPAEKQILLTTRFSDPGSTFKQALSGMEPGNEIVASKVAGDFVLPQDARSKLAFVAGGIGITPFRSMVKYVLGKEHGRDIVLLYGAKKEDDFIFRNIFEEARRKFGMKNVYTTCPLNETLIRKEVPDFAERIFYISGPEHMVEAMGKVLQGMGMPGNHVKRDYFPGYEWVA